MTLIRLRFTALLPIVLGMASLHSLEAFAASSPASSAPIFQSSSVFQGIELAAPLSDLYHLPRDIPDSGKMPSVKGTLSYKNADGTLVQIDPVSLSLRGNSSKALDQCAFAKLSVSFVGKSSTQGTIFEGFKKIKIGTHCAETETPGPTWGRVLNQKEPIREALIYTVLNRVGTTTLQARPAVITYHDTSATVDPTFFPQNPLTRNAFFLEHEEYAAVRYQAELVVKAGQPSNGAVATQVYDPQIADPENKVLSLFAETLTENSDFVVQAGYFWNVNFLKAPAGKFLLQVYDWDIAGWVRGPWGSGGFDNLQYAISSDPTITQAAIDHSVAAYLDAKVQIYADLENAFPGPTPADPDGKLNIKKHLDDFYAGLAGTSLRAIEASPVAVPSLVPSVSPSPGL